MKIPQIHVMDKNRQFKATISLPLLWHRSGRAWQCESLSHHRTLFPFLIWPLITSGSKTGQLKVPGRSYGLWCPILGGCHLADRSECVKWRAAAALHLQSRINVWAKLERSSSSRKSSLSALTGDMSEQGLWIYSRVGESISAAQLGQVLLLSLHTHPISIIPNKHILEILKPYQKPHWWCSCLLVCLVCPIHQNSDGFLKLSCYLEKINK